MLKEQWLNFIEGNWTESVDVRDFIQKNYSPYEGNEEFLGKATEKTLQLFKKASALMKTELEKGVLDIDTDNISGINNFDAGYLDKENEIIVGFQTNAPLKRMMNPFGGIRMVEASLESYGYSMSLKLNEVFHKYRKTHNEGVFDV